MTARGNCTITSSKSRFPEDGKNRDSIIDCARIPHLYERQLGLPDLLVDEVVVVLGRDVEAVALLGVELGGVQHDRDLALEHDEHLANFRNRHLSGKTAKNCGKSYHGVLVRAAHALGGVPLDPEEGEEVVGRAEGARVLNGVGVHAVALLPDVHPSKKNEQNSVFFKKRLGK